MDLNRVLIESSLPKEVRVFNIRYTPRLDVSEKLAGSLEKNGELVLSKLVRKGIIIPSTFRVDRYLSGGEIFNVASFDIFRTKLIFLGLTRPFFTSVRAVDKIKNALSIPVSELASFKNPGKFKSSQFYNISHRFYFYFLHTFLGIEYSSILARFSKDYLDSILVNQKNVKSLPDKIISTLKRYVKISKGFELDLKKNITSCINDPFSVPPGDVAETYYKFFGLDIHKAKLENIFFPISLDEIFPGRPVGRLIAESNKLLFLNQLAKMCL